MSTDLSTVIHAQRAQFLAVQSDPQINFEREAQFAMQILQGNEYAYGIASRNPNSLAAAVTNVAAIGISLNPAAKLAYLVPRDGKICLDISYMGLLHIAQQSGAIQWGQARIVRKLDEFILDSVDRPPEHKFNPFDTERGDIVGAYVVIKTDTGDYLTHAMPIGQIDAIRDRSPAWQKGKKGPWGTDYEEMIKKTVIKQAAKTWPRRERLDDAVHYLNTDGGEGITLEGEVSEQMEEGAIFDWVAAIEETPTKEEAKEVYRRAVAECEKLKDIQAAHRIKSALLAHAEVLDGKTTQGAADE